MSCKTLAFVTDQLPYPPRNGVTLPTYNYLVRLKPEFKVSLYVFFDQANPPEKEQVAENESLFGKITLIPVYQQSKLKRLGNELMGEQLFYHGWKTSELWHDAVTVDSVLVSPMNAVSKWLATGLDKHILAKTKIAAVNDCITAEFRYRRKHAGLTGFKKVKGYLDWLRSLRVASIEERYLRSFDHILLQTDADKSLLGQYVCNDLYKKVHVVSNGVNAELFGVMNTPQKKVLFIAELSREYAATAKWLVRDVWPKVHAQVSDYELVIIGKGAGRDLQRLIASDDSISHIEFVDDLKAVYAQSDIVISPVFKGYGLINKTLEAMAAGIPVVGGKEAFNGIVGFIPNQDGWVCPTPQTDDFVVAITTLAREPELREKIGHKGQQLVYNQFCWSMTVQKIKALI